MQTIKLHTADARPLTAIVSADPSLCLPHEIHLYDDGRAVACDANAGDTEYPDLAALCAAYQIDEAAVRAEVRS